MLLFSNIQNGPIRENIVIHLFDCLFNCCLRIKCDVLVLNKLKEMATSLHDTGLGEVDRAEICKNY